MRSVEQLPPRIDDALPWHTSSHSGSSGGNCVEVTGGLPQRVGVRDSKRRAAGVHVVSVATWRAFVAGVRTGALTRGR